MTAETGPPAYHPVACGPSAQLLEVADAPTALSLAEHLRATVDATDVVPGASTVLVDGAAPAALAGALSRWDPATDPLRGPLVEVPVVYDGADLAAVAEIGRAAGVRTLVDNTFASPYFQNPLTLGEDSGVLTTVALMRCYEPQLAVLVFMVVPVDEAVDPAPGFLQAVKSR